VNRAFRLQAATRRTECDCLLAAATWRQIAFLFPRDAHRRHELQLKGYPKRVPAYAVSFPEIGQALAHRPA
jgi:class 3 adenylate cyclase